MWTAFVTKFYSVLFSIFMLFNSISFSISGINSTAQLKYVFSDQVSGNAGGTISVTSDVPGSYQLYWGDEDGDRLKAETGAGKVPYTEFAAVSVSGGSGSVDVYDYLAIPEGAETVLAYQGALCRGSMEIPEVKQTKNGPLLYTFGSISDTHFNRYNLSLTGDDACITLKNALDFYEKNNVALVAHSGDICTKGEEDSLKKFNNIVSKYPFPVYSCTGNHDVGYDPIWDLWEKYVNPDIYAGTGRPDVELAENGIDFVYKPDSLGGDVFIFLSQIDWSYNSPDSRLLDDSQLDWLEAMLEKYKDTRVYLYFHTFMADADGNPQTGEGNAVNNKGVTYDLVFTVGAPDEVRMRSLMQTYKNVVFFNGHSHFDFDTCLLNPQINVTSYGGTYATFVHNPSVSSPRTMNENSRDYSERFMRSSQGYLVKVYADKIVLTGVEFWGTRFLSYATYNVYR